MRKLPGKALMISTLAGSLALVSAPARADFRNFTLDEGIVPGASSLEHSADKINGAYASVITFDQAGTFAMSAYCDFGQYFANEGGTLVLTQLNNIGPGRSRGAPGGNGYGLYAEFRLTGTISGTDLTGVTATMSVWIDPNQDTTKALPGVGGDEVVFANRADDLQILETGNLISAPGVASDPGAVELGFAVVPGDWTAAGAAYWPTLANLPLVMTVDGDLDDFEPVTTQTVTGDLSVVFEAVEEARAQPAALASGPLQGSGERLPLGRT